MTRAGGSAVISIELAGGDSIDRLAQAVELAEELRELGLEISISGYLNIGARLRAPEPEPEETTT